MPKRSFAFTLLELLIAVGLVGLVVIGLATVERFSLHNVLSSNKRAKVQNELSYALEHMSKYVQLGIGDVFNPPLEQIVNGFRVRVDFNNPRTPHDLDDDNWVSYTLDTNTLSVEAEGSLPADPSPVFHDEELSTRVLEGVTYAQMPVNPLSGFYVNFSDNHTSVEVGLAGRFFPGQAESVDNPQVTMKTSLSVRASSAN